MIAIYIILIFKIDKSQKCQNAKAVTRAHKPAGGSGTGIHIHLN